MKSWGELLESDKELATEQFLASGRKYHCVDFDGLDLERTANTERRIRYKAEHYIPQSKTPDYREQILHIEGDAVVIGDPHIPDHNNKMLNLAIAVGKKQKIKKLIVNGDLISADGLSTHKENALGPRTTVGEDIRTTKDILAVLLRCFPDGVIASTGNHDARLRWATRRQVEISGLLDEILMTPLGYLYLNSGGVKWKITHPRQYSKVPGSIARQLADIESTNIIAAHTHLLSWSITPNGLYVAIDGGHCIDVNRTAYKMETDTTHPKWCSGFVVVKNGCGYTLSEQFTDWSQWV